MRVLSWSAFWRVELSRKEISLSAYVMWSSNSSVSQKRNSTYLRVKHGRCFPKPPAQSCTGEYRNRLGAKHGEPHSSRDHPFWHFCWTKSSLRLIFLAAWVEETQCKLGGCPVLRCRSLEIGSASANLNWWFQVLAADFQRKNYLKSDEISSPSYWSTLFQINFLIKFFPILI